MFASAGKIEAYFSHLTSMLPEHRDVECLAVAHMVPNSLFFIPALDKLVNVAAVLAKPKSVPRPEYQVINKQYNTPPLSREWSSDPAKVLDTFYELGLRSKKVVIIDIGGYFSESINIIHEKFDGQILGVMEGTENGVMKYERHFPFDVPIVTVARSPLKLPEDYLVASSVVFSIEAVLREQAEILQSRLATVIGYGRVGSAVAEILRGRGINTTVFDSDPVKLAEAAARGFKSYFNRHDALEAATLVVCATGNKALDLVGFGSLRSGCIVASVTSADDELDLPSLQSGYVKSALTSSLSRYTENRTGGRHFDLVADGNAANFLHGAVIGPAIQLIEGEKLFAIRELVEGTIPISNSNIYEIKSEPRRMVAEIWNEHFL